MHVEHIPLLITNWNLNLITIRFASFCTPAPNRLCRFLFAQVGKNLSLAISPQLFTIRSAHIYSQRGGKNWW